MKALSTNEFILRATIKHNGYYDYSLVVYKNSLTEVKINCPVHNSFWQLPYNHLAGKGCIICGYKRVSEAKSSDINIFTEEASLKHNYYYDYSLSVYVDAKTDIIIICPKHGQFEQMPDKHLSGNRCPSCSYLSSFLTNEEFILKSNIKHNFIYDYTNCIFTGVDNRIKIICKIHGEFEKVASNHLGGQGCIECSTEDRRLKLAYTTEEFIEQAIEIHGDRYNYSQTIYFRRKSNVNIICKIHGVFPQVPYVHLSGSGCPKCTYKISKPETQWLDYLGIPEEQRQATIKYGENNKKWFSVDAFDPATNTIYEFHGDFYHGNPKVIKDFDAENPKNYITYKDLFLATMEKERILKEKGYKIINMWESDWNNSAEKIIIDQREKENKNQ
jgi:hypothetical protein